MTATYTRRPMSRHLSDAFGALTGTEREDAVYELLDVDPEVPADFTRLMLALGHELQRRSDGVSTDGMMPPDLADAIDAISYRRETAQAFTEHDTVGPLLSGLFAAVATELQLVDLREECLFSELDRDHAADLPDVPPPPPATGGPLFLELA
jgi:hypothetical protein